MNIRILQTMTSVIPPYSGSLNQNVRSGYLADWGSDDDTGTLAGESRSPSVLAALFAKNGRAVV